MDAGRRRVEVDEPGGLCAGLEPVGGGYDRSLIGVPLSFSAGCFGNRFVGRRRGVLLDSACGFLRFRRRPGSTTARVQIPSGGFLAVRRPSAGVRPMNARLSPAGESALLDKDIQEDVYHIVDGAPKRHLLGTSRKDLRASKRFAPILGTPYAAQWETIYAKPQGFRWGESHGDCRPARH
jgi:hypothetical protein